MIVKSFLETSNSRVRLTIEFRAEKATGTVSVFLMEAGCPLGAVLPHSGCLSSPPLGKPASAQAKNAHGVPMSK